MLLSIAAPAPAIAATAGPLARLADVVPAVAACWRPPAGTRRFERAVVTARFSLNRDGRLLGTPRVTFASDLPGDVRTLLTGSAIAAIRDCTPVRLTNELGAAIAGRPFTVRFTYRGPTGRPL